MTIKLTWQELDKKGSTITKERVFKSQRAARNQVCRLQDSSNFVVLVDVVVER